MLFRPHGQSAFPLKQDLDIPPGLNLRSRLRQAVKKFLWNADVYSVSGGHGITATAESFHKRRLVLGKVINLLLEDRR